MRVPLLGRLFGGRRRASSNGSLHYTAAGTGRRATSWLASGAGPNAALIGSLAVLRDRSRDAARKNAYAAAAVEQIVSNVVGTGIKPQSLASDEAFRKAAHALWWDWTDEADADGRLDFYGLEALCIRSVATAGEVFVRLRPRLPRDGLTVPFQVQILEAEHCPAEKNELAPNGNVIRAGIEFDRIGRRVAYWLYPQHPAEGVLQVGTASMLPVRVPADDVLHLYWPLRPGQIRGEPWLVRALVKMRELEAYDDAELTRKKAAAMFVGFVTRPDPEGAFMGEGEADADGAAEAALEPGTMQFLAPGEEIEFSEPADVGGNYEAFMRQQARLIATAIGILYEELTGDYSQLNDRTLRAALIAVRRRYAMWQHHLLAFQLCRPVWRRWLDSAVMAGALARPAGMADRDFYRAKWVAPPWPYLHPVQDVEAQVKEIRAGLATRSEKVSERGYDAEQLDREMAGDNARADGLGLSYDSDGRRAASGGRQGAGSRAPAMNDETDEEAAA